MAKNERQRRGSRELSENDSGPTYALPLPPDGGWGWVVVFSSFMIHVIADGVVYAFGVFYLEITEHFQASRGETAWIASLLVGMTFITGPLSSVLTNRFGCRAVTIAGAVVCTISFLISGFAPSVTVLFFTIGIMGGIGMGLIYLPAIVSVGWYFEKKRSLATGLAVCGSGVGTFIFAPLAAKLVEIYTWRGAMIIIGGILFNVAICGAVFRPLLPVLVVKDEEESSEDSLDEEEDQQPESTQNGVTPRAVLPDVAKLPEIPVIVIEGEGEGSGAPLLSVNGKGHPHHGQFFRSTPVMTAGLGRQTDVAPMKSEMDISTMLKQKRKLAHHHHVRNRQPTFRGPKQQLMSPMVRQDVLYPTSLSHVSQYRENRAEFLRSMVSIPSLAESHRRETVSICCGILNVSKATHSSWTEMLDFSLLKQWPFLLFAVSNFFTQCGFNTPFLYLPERAHELGIGKKDGAFLLSVVGIANMLGRAMFGAICDRKFARGIRLLLYCISLTICGIVTAMCPVYLDYTSLCVYAAMFGFTVGCYVTLTPIICVDLVGLDKLSNAFGVTLLFQGMGTFIGPPIAGWTYDALQSYDYSFVITGLLLAFSGVMLLPIDIAKRWRCGKLRKEGSEKAADA